MEYLWKVADAHKNKEIYVVVCRCRSATMSARCRREPGDKLNPSSLVVENGNGPVEAYSGVLHEWLSMLMMTPEECSVLLIAQACS